MRILNQSYLPSLLHLWFATVQEVLQADWQDAWHSPQPELLFVFMQGFWIVLMCFIFIILHFELTIANIIHQNRALYKGYLSIRHTMAASVPAAAHIPTSDSSATEKLKAPAMMEKITNAISA